MDLPAHTLAYDEKTPNVINVLDAVHGLVGSYAYDTAAGPGAFMARCVGGWTLERVKQAVEAVYKAGAK